MSEEMSCPKYCFGSSDLGHIPLSDTRVGLLSHCSQGMLAPLPGETLLLVLVSTTNTLNKNMTRRFFVCFFTGFCKLSCLPPPPHCLRNKCSF